jgi:hypothetical protein
MRSDVNTFIFRAQVFSALVAARVDSIRVAG